MLTYAEYRGIFTTRPGDVWEFPGVARLFVGSLFDVWPTLAALPAVALIYTDPPWNQANMANFYRKADAGAAPPLGNLLNTIFTIAQCAQAPLCMEMGNAFAPAAKLLARGAGLVERGDWPITYYRKHPARLLAFAPTPLSLLPSPAGLDDDDTPAWAIERLTQRNDLVLDPCAGRGLTAVSAVKAGRRFAGAELHPIRAAILLEKLHDILHANPVCVQQGE